MRSGATAGPVVVNYGLVRIMHAEEMEGKPGMRQEFKMVRNQEMCQEIKMEGKPGNVSRNHEMWQDKSRWREITKCVEKARWREVTKCVKKWRESY